MPCAIPIRSSQNDCPGCRIFACPNVTGSVSPEASLLSVSRITSTNILKSSGLIGSPCLSPRVVRIGFAPSDWGVMEMQARDLLNNVSSANHAFPRTPFLSRTLSISARSTESYAFFMSKKMSPISRPCRCASSNLTCRACKFSVHPVPALNALCAKHVDAPLPLCSKTF